MSTPRTIATYLADGATNEFDVPFPYIARAHVFVTVNGVNAIIPPTWVTSGRIRLNPTPASGSVVVVRRRTPLDPLFDFQNGAVLTEEELNKAASQVLYIQQELGDDYDAAIGDAIIKLGQGNGIIGLDPADVLDQIVAELLGDSSLIFIQDRLGDAESEIARIDDIIAGFDIGLTPDIQLVINEERDARIDGDTALINDLALLGVRGNDGNTWVLDQTKVVLTPTETLGQRLGIISTRLSGAEASIVNETTARTTAISALTSDITAQSVRIGEAEADILNEVTARVSAVQAVTEALNVQTALIDDVRADIIAESTARATAIASEASQRSALQARFNTASRQQAKRIAFTYGDWAEAQADGWFIQTGSAVMTTGLDGQRCLRLANTAGSSAELYSDLPQTYEIDLATTYVISAVVEVPASSPTSVKALLGYRPLNQAGQVIGGTDSDGLFPYPFVGSVLPGEKKRIFGYFRGAAPVGSGQRVGVVAPDITNPARSPAGTVAVLPLVLALDMTANNELRVYDLAIYPVEEAAELRAAITNEAAVRSNAISAEAAQRQQLAASAGNEAAELRAAITNEAAVLSNAISAEAAQRQQLAASVGNNAASITTLQAASSQFGARYGVQLDVNGRIIGWVANNDGQSGSIVFRTDRFAVTDPNDPAGVQPAFEVVNGVVRVRNAIIVGLGSGNISPGAATGALGATSGSTTTVTLNPGDFWAGVGINLPNATGQPVRIDAAADFISQGSGALQPGDFGLQGLVISRVIDGVRTVLTSIDIFGGSQFILDSPPAGSAPTYRLESVGAGNVSSTYNITNQRIIVTEFRR
jgi:hypothetical protein